MSKQQCWGCGGWGHAQRDCRASSWAWHGHGQWGKGTSWDRGKGTSWDGPDDSAASGLKEHKDRGKIEETESMVGISNSLKRLEAQSSSMKKLTDDESRAQRKVLLERIADLRIQRSRRKPLDVRLGIVNDNLVRFRAQDEKLAVKEEEIRGQRAQLQEKIVQHVGEGAEIQEELDRQAEQDEDLDMLESISQAGGSFKQIAPEQQFLIDAISAGNVTLEFKAAIAALAIATKSSTAS